MFTLGWLRKRWLLLLGIIFSYDFLVAVTVGQAATTALPSLTMTQAITPAKAVTPLPTRSTAMSLTPLATKSNQAEGTFGTSPWTLQDGTLTIGAGDFANNSTNTSPWNAYQDQITTINITGPINFPTTANGIFGSLSNLKQINGLEKINTSQTISLNDLFYADSQLTDVTGVENWDTSHVQTLDRTFFATALIGTLDLHRWDVSSLTSAMMTFGRTGALDDESNRLFKRLDLSGWNFAASKVGLSTFGYQIQAQVVDTSNWQNTSHITSMESMFTFSAINELDMSSFDMRHLAPSYGGTRQMFTYAFALKKLKLGPYSKLAGTGLRDVSENNKYTGFWQNIGTGTDAKPNGDQVLTTAQLVAAYDGTKGQATETFVWQQKPAQPVTVNYVDAADPTTTLQPATEITGSIDDSFTITPPKIDGYTYHGVQDDAALTGTISGTAQTVTLLYDKQGQVTVNYEDTKGHTIAPAKTMMGDLGSEYTIDQPEITDYTFKSASANLSGNYTSTPQTVTLTYQKVVHTGQVTVEYMDEAGHKVAPDTTQTGDVGTAYTITPPKIDGYLYVTGELTGTYTTTDQTVRLTYRALPTEGQITVNYVDTAGHVIAEPQTMTGKLGSSYTIEPKKIDGYTYQSGELTGTYTTANQAVTLIYQKDAVYGSVTVNYEDENGHQLAEPTTLTGLVDSTYTIEKKAIDGYTYHSGDLTGTFSATAKTVTLIYHKNAVAKGTVTVNYHDEHGKDLATTTTLTGEIGTPYHVSPKVIDGYAYQKADGNLTGTFTKEAQTVTLIYHPTPAEQGTVTITYQDDAGKSLAADTTLTGDVDSDYTITPLKVDGYEYQKASAALTGTFSSQPVTVKLTYTKKATELGLVTVNYLDLTGQPVAPLTTLTGAFGSAYTTTAKKIAGYTHVKTTGQPTGQFTAQAQVVDYIYQATTAPADRRKLTGQDFTMTVNGPKPTVTDFKAKAQDQDGQPLTVQVDLSQVKTDKVGTYPVTLKTADGQTLEVKLIVVAATDSDSDSNSAGDTINPGKQPKPSKPSSVKPGTNTKPVTSTKPTTAPLTNGLQTATTPTAGTTNDSAADKINSANQKLPATGERSLQVGMVIGLLGLLGLSFKYFKRF